MVDAAPLDDKQRVRDGRNVDGALGELIGEAGDIEVRHPDEANPLLKQGSALPVRSDTSDEVTYYGRPMLKEPVWIWTIPTYFFVGGTAGAASVIGAAIGILGEGRLDGLARDARWMAAGGDVLSAGLLIADLGRPARFLNMLRVFRPTSPMSIGSWVLSISGAANTAALLLSPLGGFASAVGRAGEYAGALLGPALAGYTAVLITNTAVPVWQGARRTLPLLFMASGVASAASIFELLDLDRRERAAVRFLAVAGKAAELVAAAAVEREVGASERAARPLHQGASGALWKTAKALGALGLAASALTAVAGRGTWVRRAAGALGVASGLATRFAVFYAGRASARDPAASFAQQRLGLGGAEVTGVLPPTMPAPVSVPG